MEKAAPPPYTAVLGPPPPGSHPQPVYQHQPGFYVPPPQQPGYYMPPQQQPVGATVVVTGAAPTVIGALGPESQRITCPYCHSQISTRIDVEPNTKTHLFALLLCLLGCWPCVCLPYCSDGCQTSKHYCPHCNAYLGAYSEN